ncbi:MAG: nucleoside-diphosphate sugar epimerase/dehydratase [Trueperaceae bacterium]|nr:nucleoside-diphosphate sugar epimerase/dehydratase [Trueperaceae bacterium]
MGVKFALDLLLWVAAAPLAYLTRFDGVIAPNWYVSLAVFTAVGLVVKGVTLWRSRLYQQSWRAVTLRDVESIVKAVVIVALVTSTVAFLLRPVLIIPRSIPILDALYALLLLASVRAVARYRHESTSAKAAPNSRRVLIVGAGEAGTLIAREMLRHPEVGMRPVGFLDDDPAKQNQRIATVPVLGTLSEVTEVMGEARIDEVLIALPSAEGRVIRDLLNKTTRLEPSITYRTIPALHELLSGEVSIDRIRKVEVEDLLRRAPVALDTSGIAAYITGQTVMVTGAGGSIGSELVRQIIPFQPGELILLGRGENSIYQLERELVRSYPDLRYHCVIANVRDAVRLEQVFKRYRPDVVFHAAAHKHVPLMESNPEEAILNNVIGTKNLVDLAVSHHVSHFVNISTDKAVNPTSVMGASKRLGEYVVWHAAERARAEQVFVSVRFGNVLGSRGSVIPLFKEQIRRGGPVTVTHPDMQRYFMTIPEATQLVLQAASQGRNGDIYILDMGEPVRIVDLAADLIRLSGFEPGADIPIVFSGIRPGEKLFEELTTEAERNAVTEHDKIFVARVPRVDREGLEHHLARLHHAASSGDRDALMRQLQALIEGANLTLPPPTPQTQTPSS